MVNALLEAAKIVEAGFRIPLVGAGETYTTRVTWKNTGGQSHAFDLLAAYGAYDPYTGDFTPYRYVFTKENISSSPEQTQTTDIPCKVEADTPEGRYDCMVMVCDLTITDNTAHIDKVYDAMVKEDFLEVSVPAIAAEITDFSIIAD